MMQALMRLAGLAVVVAAGVGWISWWWLALVPLINYGRGVLVSSVLNERLYGTIDFRVLTPSQLDESSKMVNTFALISTAKASALFLVIAGIRWLVD